MSSLAASLGVTLATATGIVDRLVERDIVQRRNDKDDRRVVVCDLSAKGHELTDRLYVSGRQRARQLLESLPPEKLKLLDAALESLTTP
jgi:DNA-binding MarR family transcriptional regulator